MFKLILSLTVLSLITTGTSFAANPPLIPEGDSAVLIYSLSEKVLDSSFKPIQEQIEDAATEQAQIWSDTILEGDYAAEGNTRLDEVIAIYKKNTLQGYKFTYSEKAWMISDCDFDEQSQESLNACLQGRIVESSYASPDFSILERDPDHLAEFYKD
jgi:hypothetical protein